VAKVSFLFHVHNNCRNLFDAYLKLVLASLRRWGWVEKIDCENLNRQHLISVYSSKISSSRNHLATHPNAKLCLAIHLVHSSISPLINLHHFEILSVLIVPRSCAESPSPHAVMYLRKADGNSLPYCRFVILVFIIRCD
jgi:hypothetical protein